MFLKDKSIIKTKSVTHSIGLILYELLNGNNSNKIISKEFPFKKSVSFEAKRFTKTILADHTLNCETMLDNN